MRMGDGERERAGHSAQQKSVPHAFVFVAVKIEKLTYNNNNAALLARTVVCDRFKCQKLKSFHQILIILY